MKLEYTCWELFGNEESSVYNRSTPTETPDMNSPAPQNYTTGSRLVTLVDEHDNLLGEADIFEAHRYPTQLHRAISVWLFRQSPVTGEWETLFQQRSSTKPVGADWWGNAVCGNVKPDENYLECAQRRLIQELGIAQPSVLNLKRLYSFHYQAYGNQEYGEHELDTVFIADFDEASEARAGTIKPIADEVQAVAWIPVRELFNWAESFDSLTAQQTLEHNQQQLKELAPPRNFNWNDADYLTHPWGILMARDPRLQGFEKFL